MGIKKTLRNLYKGIELTIFENDFLIKFNYVYKLVNGYREIVLKWKDNNMMDHEMIVRNSMIREKTQSKWKMWDISKWNKKRYITFLSNDVPILFIYFLRTIRYFKIQW